VLKRFLAVWGLCLVLANLVACKGSARCQKETWYSSAVWSPDGKQIAYFRRYLEYEEQKPFVNLFVTDTSRIVKVVEDRLFLCINDITGKNERAIKEIAYDLPQPDQYTIPHIETGIIWGKEGIQYGAAVRDVFSTGVRQVFPEGGGDKQIDQDPESVSKLTAGIFMLKKVSDNSISLILQRLT